MLPFEPHQCGRIKIMTNSKLLTLSGAIAITAGGFALTATTAVGQPPKATVVVEGQRIDPELQRIVSYRDLNLAFRSDQKTLNTRIHWTARDLCLDLNGYDKLSRCTTDAVHSTDDQVAAAIDRADRKMAGLPIGPAVAISMVIGTK
jgi:UrcA family protein